jgi:hypothetical protein
MFEQFIELQDRILAIVRRSEAALLNPEERDVAELGKTRWELARSLREYQLFKQTSIFDPIERTQDSRAPRTRRMRAECERAGEAFRQYVLKWSVVSILDYWDDYKAAALTAMTQVRAQLSGERNDMAELLGVRRAA